MNRRLGAGFESEIKRPSSGGLRGENIGALVFVVALAFKSRARQRDSRSGVPRLRERSEAFDRLVGHAVEEPGFTVAIRFVNHRLGGGERKARGPVGSEHLAAIIRQLRYRPMVPAREIRIVFGGRNSKALDFHARLEDEIRLPLRAEVGHLDIRISGNMKIPLRVVAVLPLQGWTVFPRVGLRLAFLVGNGERLDVDRVIGTHAGLVEKNRFLPLAMAIVVRRDHMTNGHTVGIDREILVGPKPPAGQRIGIAEFSIDANRGIAGVDDHSGIVALQNLRRGVFALLVGHVLVATSHAAVDLEALVPGPETVLAHIARAVVGSAPEDDAAG